MLLYSFTLGSQSRSVVPVHIVNKILINLPSYLLIAKARRPGSDDTVITIEFDWHESSRVVGSNWTEDAVSLAASDSAHAKLVVHADRGRS